MKINIQYFGLLAEAIGKRNETIVVTEKCTVGALQKILLESYPMLKGKRFKVAVNQELATKETIILEQDAIALLPPFAGG